MQFGAEPDQGKKPNVNRALWGWQYTSTGRVPGINGNADLDICYQDPAGTDETGTESGTIWCLFSPILFCAVTEKKKPITRAVISFFRIYHILNESRSSRNRTHIDGFGDHCSTFELCSYHGPDRTDELYYSKLSRQKQVFFAKRSAGGCHSARSAHLLRRPCENVPAGSGCETAFCRIRSEKEEEM